MDFAREKFKIGTVVRLNTKPDIGDLRNYFIITGYGSYFDDKNRAVVMYKTIVPPYSNICQSIHSFMSRVSHDRYPDCNSEWKFEPVTSLEEIVKGDDRYPRLTRAIGEMMHIISHDKIDGTTSDDDIDMDDDTDINESEDVHERLTQWFAGQDDEDDDYAIDED